MDEPLRHCACGLQFAVPRKNPGQLYCSRPCAVRFKRRRVGHIPLRACPCGQSFPVRTNTSMQRFCSLACAHAARARPLADRFLEKVDRSGDCWLWTGGTTSPTSNYGVIGVNGGTKLAHRVSWELHRGPIPAGMQVCHHCDVPACVRPDHLFLGTQRDNMLDREAKGRGMRALHWDNRPAKGERHVCAKLTAAHVLAIRARLPQTTHATLAREYGVSRQAVSDIAEGRTWRHV